jgi:hypothetical protein
MQIDEGLIRFFAIKSKLFSKFAKGAFTLFMGF